MKQIEHRLQCGAVQWFHYAHPKLSPLLFAIPNGGKRDKKTGAKMKAEGVKAGIPDLMLAYPCGGYHGLYLETKAPKGKLTPAQKEYRSLLQAQGYAWAEYRDIQEFISIISNYMSCNFVAH